jgi:hypothetical protein
MEPVYPVKQGSQRIQVQVIEKGRKISFKVYIRKRKARRSANENHLKGNVIKWGLKLKDYYWLKFKRKKMKKLEMKWSEDIDVSLLKINRRLRKPESGKENQFIQGLRSRRRNTFQNIIKIATKKEKINHFGNHLKRS